jgi:nucleoid DNA-binding protein
VKSHVALNLLQMPRPSLGSRSVGAKRSGRHLELIGDEGDCRWRSGTKIIGAEPQITQPAELGTAGVFLDTLSALAYKEIKKNGEFVLPGFGKPVKQKRKARTGFNPKTQQKIKIPPRPSSNFVLPRPQRTGFWG